MTYDQRLEHLLSTAAHVFGVKGYYATTMRDLSRETGMSLAGMYYYVSGKEELLALIQERVFTEVVEGAQSAVEGGTDAIDRLQRLIEHHVAFFAQHMDEMKVLSHEAESLSAKWQSKIDALKRRYVDLVTDVLAALNPDETPRIPHRVAAYALFGMMNWIYTWYDVTGPVAPEELADHFTQLYLHGVARQAPSVAP